MKHNTHRKLKSFNDDIKNITDNGFNPIGICQMYFYDTFVFETTKEAKSAYNKLEKELKLVIGWWYGKKDFLKAVEKYENTEGAYKVKIFWLNNK